MSEKEKFYRFLRLALSGCLSFLIAVMILAFIGILF